MDCKHLPHHIMGDLLRARNLVAHYLSQSLNIDGSIRLPKPGGKPIVCQHCVYDRSCVFYNKAIENGSEAGSDRFRGRYDTMTNHLSPTHLEYFRLWDKLIELEQQAGAQTFAWRLPPQEREKSGRALCSLRLEKFEELSPSLFEYTFRREGSSSHLSESDDSGEVLKQSSEDRPDRAISGLAPGDYVILSTMEGIVHLGRGPLRAIGHDHVVIHLDRSLRLPPGISLRSSLWVIDKDELSSGLMRARQVPPPPPFFLYCYYYFFFSP